MVLSKYKGRLTSMSFNPSVLPSRKQSCTGGGLVARIKMVLSGGFKMGDYNPSLMSQCAGRLPTRCAFQLSALDGAEETFHIEYVMRMMEDWAKETTCDPYLKIQNTGVSVLIQGFFDAPPGASKAPISPEKCNIVLSTTETTGISLSDVDRIKLSFGVDTRPFQACLSVCCFVRLPRVQLAFRFVGPTDPSRISRLVEAAEESYITNKMQRLPLLHGGCLRSSYINTTTNVRDTDYSDDDYDISYPTYTKSQDYFANTHKDQLLRNRTRQNTESKCIKNGKLNRNTDMYASASDIKKTDSLFSVATKQSCKKDEQPNKSLITHMKITACITSTVTLAVWLLIWCIKDVVFRQ